MKKPTASEEITCTEDKSADSSPAKMTIYEYEQKYVRDRNAKRSGRVVRWAAVLVGAVLLVLFASLAVRLYEVNEYAGYVSAVVLALLFIFIYVVPTVKFLSLDRFETDVNYLSAGRAKKHNKKLRRSLAKRFVEFSAESGNAGRYDGAAIKKLETALLRSDDPAIRSALTELYGGSVRKNADRIILKSAVKCGTMSALSQSERLDTAIVVAVNLQLVRDISFLYGFRPSDARLARLFLRVLQNALVAYGVNSVGANIGNGIAKTVDGIMRDIPLLGSVISTVVDSSVQGLTNGTLTAVIGYQTVRYLAREYRLQDLLDDVVLVTDEEVEQTCKELKRELKANTAR